MILFCLFHFLCAICQVGKRKNKCIYSLSPTLLFSVNALRAYTNKFILTKKCPNNLPINQSASPLSLSLSHTHTHTIFFLSHTHTHIFFSLSFQSGKNNEDSWDRKFNFDFLFFNFHRKMEGQSCIAISAN